jgi:hypothetical protein
MNTTELPMYQSHKNVWAFKIKVIYPKIDTAEIFPEDGTYGWITVSDDYIVKHNPEIGGYYVRDEDGYESYSPAKAFEDGYTLMPNKEVDYDKFQRLVEECAPEPRPEEELLKPKGEKQALVDMMADDEKDGLYDVPKTLSESYTSPPQPSGNTDGRYSDEKDKMYDDTTHPLTGDPHFHHPIIPNPTPQEVDPVDRTGTLNFNLPDASCDFKRAVNANQIATALYEICTNRKKWGWRMEAMLRTREETEVNAETRAEHWSERQTQIVDEFLDSIMADITWTLEENNVHLDTLIE